MHHWYIYHPSAAIPTLWHQLKGPEEIHLDFTVARLMASLLKVLFG